MPVQPPITPTPTTATHLLPGGPPDQHDVQCSIIQQRLWADVERAPHLPALAGSQDQQVPLDLHHPHIHGSVISDD
jgi:hypothetical protein